MTMSKEEHDGVDSKMSIVVLALTLKRKVLSMIPSLVMFDRERKYSL